MFADLTQTIENVVAFTSISEMRKLVLKPLIDVIKHKTEFGLHVNLLFVCTHNSRRSHFAQIWAQTASTYFNVPNVYSYSGGTEETQLYPKVAETLAHQGFSINLLADKENPIYAIKFSENAAPIIGFSKRYQHAYNPACEFIAIMTCAEADEACPFIAGAEKRIAIPYEDPKVSDFTAKQTKVYEKRSRQIAAEMLYVFSQII